GEKLERGKETSSTRERNFIGKAEEVTMRLPSCLRSKDRLPCTQEEDLASMRYAGRPKEPVLSSKELSCIQQGT
ncbi:unnamed protein product, partial [Citrullus colocynthis]